MHLDGPLAFQFILQLSNNSQLIEIIPRGHSLCKKSNDNKQRWLAFAHKPNIFVS